MHKILLVDDMRSFLDLETTFLRRAECTVLTAGTGLEAVRLARAERPQLIVLDIEMPEMNGIQACRILKSDPATKEIPILILTSMQMEDEARRAGANRFARKPIDEVRFLEEVKRFLPIHERNESRAVLDVPVSLWRDGEPAEGRLVNLSAGGFFVATDRLLPLGARVEVTFSLPNDFSGKRINGEAMIVRVSNASPSGLGCRFFQISSAARGYIEEFVDRAGARV